MNSAKSYRYQVVDVFTRTPLEGNPLAIFAGADRIAPPAMQSIARELNLAETVFLLRPRRADCAARLRIFTPKKEMDFAGHPTIGAAFALVRQGVVNPTTDGFRVEENVGEVPIFVDKKEPDMFWLRTPPIVDGARVDKKSAAALLGLEAGALGAPTPQVLSAGNPTLFVNLTDKAAVDRASVESSGWRAIKAKYQFGPMCVFIFAATAEGAYSRMFAPDYGFPEDPATGSSTGPLARYMMLHGLLPSAGVRFVSEQGTGMGRRSLLHVRVQGKGGAGGIDVGGFVTPVIEAELHF